MRYVETFFTPRIFSYLHISFFNPYTDTCDTCDTWRLFLLRASFHICTYLFSIRHRYSRYMRYVETFFTPRIFHICTYLFSTLTQILRYTRYMKTFFTPRILLYLHVSFFNPYTNTCDTRDTWRLFLLRVSYHIFTYFFQLLHRYAIHAIRGDFISVL